MGRSSHLLARSIHATQLCCSCFGRHDGYSQLLRQSNWPDEDASIKFGIRLQSRVEIANASDSDGNDHDIQEDATTDDPQSINFFLPRARLYMKGKYGDGYKFQLTYMGDKIGRKGANDRGDVGVRYATIGKEIKSDVT